MEFDTLDWFLSVIFLSQVFMMYYIFRVCNEQNFRKTVELVLKNAGENLNEVKGIFLNIVKVEIAVFITLFMYRYFRNLRNYSC
jgi:Na+-transporting NADH:ubiquinone oxidoreductase subunit NqrE